MNRDELIGDEDEIGGEDKNYQYKNIQKQKSSAASD
jgi:hypothetical protein